MRERLAETGVHVVVMPGELTTAIGAIGDPEGVAELGLEGMAGVDRVVPISRPYKLASSELSHHEPAASRSRAARRRRRRDVLPRSPGPCTVESREQTLAVARGGRTRAARRCCAAAPSSRARRRSRSRAWARRRWRSSSRRARQTGLPIVTELLDAAARRGDRARSPTSCRSARATCRTTRCSRSPAGSASRSLLKRGLSSSLDELLMAADYILKEGTEEVILCERGIRTFETATRFTLDLGAVPWLKMHTAPAGGRRPEPRGRRPPTGRADVARGGRGRRRRDHSSRSTTIPSTPAATARSRCIPRDFAPTHATSRRTRGCWASGWPSARAAARHSRSRSSRRCSIKLRPRWSSRARRRHQTGRRSIVVEQGLGLSFHGRSST